MYQCILVDDEPHAIEKLRTYLCHFPELAVLEAHTDPMEALRSINRLEQVDLVFLDVDMPGMSGLELARLIRPKTRKLILNTSYMQYGYEAFQAEVDAYLLKPYNLSQFSAILYKMLLALPRAKDSNPTDTFFFVKSREEDLKMVRVNYRDVCAIESMGNYIKIHLHDSYIVTYMSLADIALALRNHPHFIQVQRSFIVSDEFIKQIDGNTLKLSNGLKISIGSGYRQQFNQFLSGKIIKADKTGKVN